VLYEIRGAHRLRTLRRDEPIITGQTFESDGKWWIANAVLDGHGEFDGVVLVEPAGEVGPGGQVPTA
jgi:hypothetical protein